MKYDEANPVTAFTTIRQKKLSTFKRMFYHALVKFIQESENTFCALTGPRQVGKTYALLQLTQELSSSYKINYYNIKQLRNSSQESFVDRLLQQINSCEVDVSIIDELTYIKDYPQFLVYLKNEIMYCKNRVKVILIGSSTAAIKSVCMRCIANDIIYCNVSFLNFQEYLVSKGKLNNYNTATLLSESVEEIIKCYSDITIDDYTEYVENAYKFANILEIEEYLTHCIDENVISRSNSSWAIPVLGHMEFLNTDVTLSLLYMVLYTLRKSYTGDSLNESIFSLASERQKIKRATGLKNLDIKKLYSESVLANRVQKLFGIKWFTIKASLNFLFHSGIITFQFKDYDISFNELNRWFSADTRVEESNVLCGMIINDLRTFFENVNVLIVSPLPYVAILKNLCIVIKKSYGIDITLSDLLRDDIFGDYLETALKGDYSLTTDSHCVIGYHDENDCEIDIVDYNYKVLIEISKNDKSIKNTWFSKFPYYEDYFIVLIGNEPSFVKLFNGIEAARLPYPLAALWFDSIDYQRLLAEIY